MHALMAPWLVVTEQFRNLCWAAKVFDNLFI